MISRKDLHSKFVIYLSVYLIVNGRVKCRPKHMCSVLTYAQLVLNPSFLMLMADSYLEGTKNTNDYTSSRLMRRRKRQSLINRDIILDKVCESDSQLGQVFSGKQLSHPF